VRYENHNNPLRKLILPHDFQNFWSHNRTIPLHLKALNTFYEKTNRFESTVQVALFTSKPIKTVGLCCTSIFASIIVLFKVKIDYTCIGHAKLWIYIGDWRPQSVGEGFRQTLKLVLYVEVGFLFDTVSLNP
jgi:hypothetical protein